jgi:hypothetical protein
MGSGIAGTLLRNSFETAVYDIDRTRVVALEADRAR